MEYTKVVAGPNGGEVVPMTEEEIKEFVQFQEEELNRPPSKQQLLLALLASLPDDIRGYHYNTVCDVERAVEKNDWAAIPYILSKVTPRNESEVSILQQFQTILNE